MLGTSINLVALSFFIGWWDGNAKDEKNQLYDSLLFFSCQLLFGCWDFWTFRMDQKNIGFFVFFLLASWIGTYRRKKVTTVTEVKRFFLRSKSLGGGCFQEIL